MKTIRLTDILILILGLAILVDMSVQLRRTDNDIVWQPITESPASGPGCCAPANADGLSPVFTA